MNTVDWGPKMWFSMFIIAANYPQSKVDPLIKKQTKEFFIGIGNVLPCKYCRSSYKIFIKELPITKFLSGRKKLMYWLYKIKDKVNKKLLKQYKEGKIKKKPVKSPPFEKVCKYYEQFRAACSDKTKTCQKPKL